MKQGSEEKGNAIMPGVARRAVHSATPSNLLLVTFQEEGILEKGREKHFL